MRNLSIYISMTVEQIPSALTLQNILSTKQFIAKIIVK